VVSQQFSGPRLVPTDIKLLVLINRTPIHLTVRLSELKDIYVTTRDRRLSFTEYNLVSGEATPGNSKLVARH
jgi:hypothetical protein